MSPRSAQPASNHPAETIRPTHPLPRSVFFAFFFLFFIRRTLTRTSVPLFLSTARFLVLSHCLSLSLPLSLSLSLTRSLSLPLSHPNPLKTGIATHYHQHRDYQKSTPSQNSFGAFFRSLSLSPFRPMLRTFLFPLFNGALAATSFSFLKHKSENFAY